MRTVLVPILFLLSNMYSYAITSDTTRQEKLSCYDSSYFDGYYIVLYQKDDIISLEKNRERKTEGKSYEVPFESPMLRFFISKDSIAKKDFGTIVNDLHKKNKREIFIECTKDYAELIGSEFCINKELLLKCQWPKFSSDNKYFTTYNKSAYCFKVYEIAGWFLKLRVNTEAKMEAIGKKIRYVDPHLKEFDAYFFLGYKTYSNVVAALKYKIHLWKEVPPIFE
jgi:hypothetical protein